MVLKRKALSQLPLEKLLRLFKGGLTIQMIKNNVGKTMENRRLSLRQGDRPSRTWFNIGVDGLLLFLEKWLKGIPLYKLPVLGPVPEDTTPTLALKIAIYKVIGILDDIKPAITDIDEF